MTFIHTIAGEYITQSVLHAFIALILVEISFHAWDIDDHLSMFRYRILTLGLPIIMFPLFQVISPDRGSWYFRLTTALFDSQRWLDLKVMGIFPLAIAFMGMLAAFSLLFVMQEILPIFRGRRASQEFGDCQETHEYDARMQALLESICIPLQIEKPLFLVIDETVPILFTQGFRRHTVIISDHLLVTLDDEQLRAALTHEVVHMMRSSSLKTPLIYLLRMLMFYNPVSLVEFRRIVHDDEFICDAITISITGKPEALITALSAFYYHHDSTHADEQEGGLSQMKERVESHSHNLILDERAEKLQNALRTGTGGFRLIPFIITASVIVVTGYLVV
ncbi:MAG: M56 family metallopeptidase [Thermodesulfovibrionales bacterium]